MKKAVIFDWSGTLNNNFESFFQVCELMFRELGSKPITRDEIRRTFSLPYMKFWNAHFPGLDREEQDKLFKRYTVMVKQPEIYPEAKPIIEYLRKKKVMLFVVSSDPKITLIPEIKKSGLDNFIEKVYGEVYQKEPTLKKIVKEYLLDKKNTYYVGDTSGDIDAGKAAGVITIGISWGYQHKDILSKSKPDYLIDSLEDIKKIIG